MNIEEIRQWREEVRQKYPVDISIQGLVSLQSQATLELAAQVAELKKVMASTKKA